MLKNKIVASVLVSAIAVFGITIVASRSAAAPVIRSYVASVVPALAAPSPSPVYNAASGVDVVDSPSPVDVAPPDPSPTTPSIENFPPPPAKPSPVPGVTPLPAIPETMIAIGCLDYCGGPYTADNIRGSGPFYCTGSCTITWTACFQGGFTGSTVETCGQALPGVTFTWSDGHVGATDTVTYSTPGKYGIEVTVTEAYNGHVYQAGSGSGVTVTVS